MVKEVNELKNAELKENTLKIINAQNALKKDQWVIVNALGVILIEKQWEDDFKSQNEFGEYLGLSTGNISQYRNAYRFAQITKADCTKLSVSNAYLLSTLVKEEETIEGTTADFSEYLEFEKWCKENEKIDFMTYSQKKLRETIKNFRKEKAGEDASEKASENASEKASEKASENASEKASENASEKASEKASETTEEQICNKLEICLNAIQELTADELKELRKEINKLLK